MVRGGGGGCVDESSPRARCPESPGRRKSQARAYPRHPVHGKGKVVTEERRSGDGDGDGGGGGSGGRYSTFTRSGPAAPASD
jgi:hypothetical protein